MTPLTHDQIFITVLGFFALVFYALRKGLNAFIEYQIKKLKMSPGEGTIAFRLARYYSAQVVLKVMNTLAVTAVSLVLALGIAKAFTVYANLFLPDKAGGLMLIISYCGLPAIFGVVIEDIPTAFKEYLKEKIND